MLLCAVLNAWSVPLSAYSEILACGAIAFEPAKMQTMTAIVGCSKIFADHKNHNWVSPTPFH